jgi:hypothetical protein
VVTALAPGFGAPASTTRVDRVKLHLRAAELRLGLHDLSKRRSRRDKVAGEDGGLRLGVERLEALVAVAGDRLAQHLVLGGVGGRHLHRADGVRQDLAVGADDALAGLDADVPVASREQEDGAREDKARGQHGDEDEYHSA